MISFNGSLYRYEIDKNLFVAEHHYQSEVNNPLNFCVIKENHIVLKVLYGEYFWNEKKGPVSIFCRENNKWTKVYTFPEKSITHIHNIIFDDIRNVYFILTGDLNEESGVWVADLNFERVKPLLLGQQRFRSCVAFPTRKGLLYATDTPLEKNYIYEVCIDSNMNVSEINSISELQGPCIYGTNYNNKFYFSTSVEPDSTLSKWNYRFTNKLGKGVLSRYSYIVEVDHNCDVKTICSLKKDGFPMWLFQFGNIHFPENEMFPLMFTSQALRGGHNKTYILGGKNEE